MRHTWCEVRGSRSFWALVDELAGDVDVFVEIGMVKICTEGQQYMGMNDGYN